MENPCTILCLGDSLTRGYVPFFEQRFKEKLPDVDATIINAGTGGQTSHDALRRLDNYVKQSPNVVLLCFGMNDRDRGISLEEFSNNLCKMTDIFERIGAQVLLLTFNPATGSQSSDVNRHIEEFNRTIRDVAHKKRVRLVDINSAWKRIFKKNSKGLRDTIHPNDLGNSLYAKILVQHMPRRNIIILWQYNGNPAECNYTCPYCSYDPREQKGHYFRGTTESWRKVFKGSFGNQHLVFYLAHGEPMIGDRFYDVLQMVGEEPNWEVRVTTNLSPSLEPLIKTKVVREGRFNINASFHPTMVKREDFLEKLLYLREHGIEAPVIYVLWPPFFRRFEEDFNFFNKHNFLVHVRRFRGNYRGKSYPESYTEEERRFVARYADDATIKYMLSNEPSSGKLTWTGVDFMIMDNEGNVGYCDDYGVDKYCFGNIFKDNLRLFTEPQPFPKGGVSDGTVDGVANFLELGYRQLEKNNVISFSHQGGVYHTDKGVYYKNMHTNFNDRRIRTDYRFPPRDFVDCLYVLFCRKQRLFLRLREVARFLWKKFI